MQLKIKPSKLQSFILVIVLIFFSGNIINANPGLSDEALETRSQKIYKGIRCLVCQNQSIEDSSAGLAKQLKVIIKELLNQGYTDQEIRDYLVERYGNWILLKPPFNLSTSALWVLPFIILFFALIFGTIYIYNKSKNQKETSNNQLKKEEEKELSKILDDFR